MNFVPTFYFKYYTNKLRNNYVKISDYSQLFHGVMIFAPTFKKKLLKKLRKIM